MVSKVQEATLIRSISGVRGIVGTGLSPDDVRRHAAAFHRLLPAGVVLLARDSRPHGAELAAVASRHLVDLGRIVLNADIIPTPTAQFLVCDFNLAGGLVITASHNPVEWNGLKFIGSDGCFLGSRKCEELFQLADLDGPSETTRPGREKQLPDGAGRHILDIMNLSALDVETIQRRRFRVVVDAVNGAASLALPMLLEALGCEVIKLYTTPDGTFPRGTEPLPENLSALCQTVRERDAHLGFATDPDGDRLALVDETGKPLGEELTQVLAVDGFLRRTASRKPVVTNLSSSMLLDRLCARFGIEVRRSPVGEIHVVTLMRSVDADIGGEGNGGVILTESHLGRDALIGAALILDRLTQEDITLSEIRASLPQFEMVKDRIPIGDLDARGLISRIAARFGDAEQNHEDGLKLLWTDRWIHIRASNTEPIFRLYAEAPTRADAVNLVKQVREVLDLQAGGTGS